MLAALFRAPKVALDLPLTEKLDCLSVGAILIELFHYYYHNHYYYYKFQKKINEYI
jgi:hypothetical protein